MKVLDFFKDLHGAVDLGEITVWHHLGRLVADTDLEACRAPVDKLNGTLGLEGCDRAVDVIGDNITTVEETCGHVFAVAGVALHHLVVRLEARHGDLLDRVGLMRSLSSRDDWRVGDEREMNSRIWDKVGLELSQVNVEGAIEAERGSNGRDNCITISERTFTQVAVEACLVRSSG